MGDRVRVEMSIDADYDLPADAKAVVVAPSMVSDRYVQFTPVYNGGADAGRRRRLPLDRTAVPVELDADLRRARRAPTALGPNGANKDGALSDLLEVGAANLDGNGEALNRTLTGFSQAVRDARGEPRRPVRHRRQPADFTTTIATSDARCGFNRDLAGSPTSSPASARTSPRRRAAVASALGEVATFVRDNTDALTTNVNRLAEVTGVLVKQRGAGGVPRRRADRAGQPGARLQPRLRHARHPGQRPRATGRRGRRLRPLAQAGRLDLAAACPTRSPPDALQLPDRREICARLLPATPTPTARPRPERLGIARLEEPRQALSAASPGRWPATAPLPGLPAVTP